MIRRHSKSAILPQVLTGNGNRRSDRSTRVRMQGKEQLEMAVGGRFRNAQGSQDRVGVEAPKLGCGRNARVDSICRRCLWQVSGSGSASQRNDKMAKERRSVGRLRSRLWRRRQLLVVRVGAREGFEWSATTQPDCPSKSRLTTLGVLLPCTRLCAKEENGMMTKPRIEKGPSRGIAV